jgi:hypothetical protein
MRSALAVLIERNPTMKHRTIRLLHCAGQMSHEERQSYRAKMQAARTPEAKEALRTLHRSEMQERARAAGREGQCEPLGPRGGGQGAGPGAGQGAGQGRGAAQ